MPDFRISAVKYSLPNVNKSSVPQNSIEFDNDA